MKQRSFRSSIVVTGGSVGLMLLTSLMETLIRIAQYSGDSKYLESIPRALAYFKSSLLQDGTVARYYELRSNKPLFMDARLSAVRHD